MISVIIPIYNEVSTIDTLHQRLSEESLGWGYPFETIFIDDGSTDGSLEKLIGLSQEHSNCTVIRLSRNFGHQAALSAGFPYVSGDAAVIIDGDLQDPIEEIKNFITKWEEGFQVVYGERAQRKENILLRLFYSIFYKMLGFLSPFKIPLNSGDFCLMDRKVIDVLNTQITEKQRFHRGLRAFSGFKQIGIKYERAARFSGRSKYTLSKLLKLAFDGLLDFSTLPLQFATLVGFFVSFISFLLGLFFIIHRVIDFKIFGYSPADVPGLASLAVGLFFIGGLILMILGIIGEYVGRIYFEVKQRPQFIIEDVYGHNAE